MLNAKYLQQDKRIGDRLYINGRDAYLLYNADLKEFFEPQELSEFSADYQKLPGGSGLLLLSNKLPAKKLQIQCYIGGADDDFARINASSFVAACRECVICRSGSRFEYPAILLSYADEDSGVPPYRLVTLNFAVIRRGPLVAVAITGSGKIFNDGNISSGVKYEITPASNLSEFTISGVKCKNLSAGKTFVIDGISGRVHAEGVNRFADTDLSEFPKIQPGENQILMSSPVPVTVSFYPIYL